MKKSVLQLQLAADEQLRFACHLDQQDSEDAVCLYTYTQGEDEELRVRVYMSRAQLFELVAQANHVAGNLVRRLENDARGIPPPAPAAAEATKPAPKAGPES